MIVGEDQILEVLAFQYQVMYIWVTSFYFKMLRWSLRQWLETFDLAEPGKVCQRYICKIKPQRIYECWLIYQSSVGANINNWFKVMNKDVHQIQLFWYKNKKKFFFLFLSLVEYNKKRLSNKIEGNLGAKISRIITTSNYTYFIITQWGCMQ